MTKVINGSSDREEAEAWRKAAGLNTTKMGLAIGLKGRAGYERWLHSDPPRSMHPSNQKVLTDLIATDPKTFDLDAYLHDIHKRESSQIDNPLAAFEADIKALYETFSNRSVNDLAKIRRLLALGKLVQHERKELEALRRQLTNGEVQT